MSDPGITFPSEALDVEVTENNPRIIVQTSPTFISDSEEPRLMSTQNEIRLFSPSYRSNLASLLRVATQGDVPQTEDPNESRISNIIANTHPIIGSGDVDIRKKLPSFFNFGEALDKKLVTLLECDILTDVAFFVGPEEPRLKTRAHKLIIALSSPVFFAMFYGSLGSPDEVIITDVEPAAFTQFIVFLYMRRCTMSSNQNALAILYIAHKYDVKELETLCIEHLSANLNTTDILKILWAADAYKSTELEKTCWKFIQENTLEVLQNNLESLEDSQLVNILKDDVINVDEIDLFLFVLKWGDIECTKKDILPTKDNLLRRIGEALKYIRFPTMNSSDFANTVVPKGILNSDQVGKILYYICASEDKKGEISVEFPTKPRQLRNDDVDSDSGPMPSPWNSTFSIERNINVLDDTPVRDSVRPERSNINLSRFTDPAAFPRPREGFNNFGFGLSNTRSQEQRGNRRQTIFQRLNNFNQPSQGQDNANSSSTWNPQSTNEASGFSFGIGSASSIPFQRSFISSSPLPFYTPVSRASSQSRPQSVLYRTTSGSDLHPYMIVPLDDNLNPQEGNPNDNISGNNNQSNTAFNPVTPESYNPFERLSLFSNVIQANTNASSANNSAQNNHSDTFASISGIGGNDERRTGSRSESRIGLGLGRLQLPTFPEFMRSTGTINAFPRQSSTNLNRASFLGDLNAANSIGSNSNILNGNGTVSGSSNQNLNNIQTPLPQTLEQASENVRRIVQNFRSRLEEYNNDRLGGGGGGGGGEEERNNASRTSRRSRRNNNR